MTRPSRGERESIAFNLKNARLDRPMRFNLNFTDIENLQWTQGNYGESNSIAVCDSFTRARKSCDSARLHSLTACGFALRRHPLPVISQLYVRRQHPVGFCVRHPVRNVREERLLRPDPPRRFDR